MEEEDKANPGQRGRAQSPRSGMSLHKATMFAQDMEK